MKPKPHILLTGASGTVGQEVLKQLCRLRESYQITVFDIKSASSLKVLSPFRDKAEIVYGDISVFEDIKKVCINKDFVIHLAAIIPPLADENPGLANRVNVIGTENLVRSLEQYSPKAFLIYSSSISVYGDRVENPMIRVGDPLVPSDKDEYAKTKIIAEGIIRNSSLDWSIFRLTAIMGKHKISKLMFHMPLESSMEIATPGDTARAFVNALKRKEFISKKTFNLGGGKECRTNYKDFLTNSFKIFGLGKLNFPEQAFAQRNFHCGFYEDGDDLENILRFRNDSIGDYYNIEKNKVSLFRKCLTSFFKKPIKNQLLKKSEPYQAFIANNIKMINHYFKK
ncbi:MAG TPA: NAD(P)-dependent oxidoreductase [Rikenellaceae bacterium]|nr:NAD(P)-dependent oxidoreductase [Rikenellaceae bacterium]